MASQSTFDLSNSRVRRQVVGSTEADIIAAVRGDQCGIGEPKDAREERVMTMAMKMDDTTSPNLLGRVRKLYDQLGLLPLSLIQLMARVGLAMIFWRSGQAKIANWDL